MPAVGYTSGAWRTNRSYRSPRMLDRVTTPVAAGTATWQPSRAVDFTLPFETYGAPNLALVATLLVESWTSTAFAIPSGWTRIYNASTTGGVGVVVFVKLDATASDATPQFTQSAGGAGYLTVELWSDVDTSRSDCITATPLFYTAAGSPSDPPPIPYPSVNIPSSPRAVSLVLRNFWRSTSGRRRTWVDSQERVPGTSGLTGWYPADPEMSPYGLGHYKTLNPGLDPRGVQLGRTNSPLGDPYVDGDYSGGTLRWRHQSLAWPAIGIYPDTGEGNWVGAIGDFRLITGDTASVAVTPWSYNYDFDRGGQHYTGSIYIDHEKAEVLDTTLPDAPAVYTVGLLIHSDPDQILDLGSTGGSSRGIPSAQQFGSAAITGGRFLGDNLGPTIRTVAATRTTATGTAIVAPVPAGTQPGDLLIASFNGASAVLPKMAAGGVPAGWTLLSEQLNGSSVALSAYWKIAGASEPASYTFTLASSSSSVRIGVTTVIRAAHQTLAPTVVAAARGAAASSWTITAATPTYSSGLLVDIVGLDSISDPSNSFGVGISPTSTKELWEYRGSGIDVSGDNVDQEISYLLLGEGGVSEGQQVFNKTNYSGTVGTARATALSIAIEAPQPQAIAPAAVPSGERFGGAAVALAGQITSPGVPSSEAFGAPTIPPPGLTLIGSLQSSSTPSTAVAVTTTGAVPAGGTAIVFAGVSGTTNLNSVTGGGLTWTRLSPANNIYPNAWIAPCPNGLAAGATITLTYSASAIHTVVFVASWPRTLVKADEFNRQAQPTAASESFTTDRPLQADTVAVEGVWANPATTFSAPNAGWALVTQAQTSARAMALAWRPVPAAGAAPDAGLTMSPSTSWFAEFLSLVPVYVKPTGIPSGEAFGAVAVIGPRQLTAQGIASAEAFGSPRVQPGTFREDFEGTGLNPDFEWNLGTGSTGWTVVPAVVVIPGELEMPAHSGSHYLAPSNRGVNNSVAEATATVTIPPQHTATRVRFWWAGSSEENYDFLRVLVDGVLALEHSGGNTFVDWTKFEQMVAWAAGTTHTITFRYSKDSSYGPNFDQWFIDDFAVDVAPQIVPASIPSDEGFGGPTVTSAPTVIHAVAIASAEAFGQTAPAPPGGAVPPGTVVPPAPGGSTTPSTGPVIGGAPPGAARSRTASWLWDPVANVRYDWPLNHSGEQPVAVTRSESRGAPRLDVGFARQQRPVDPTVLQLEGTILDPAQLAALENFYDRCGLWPVIFHDADGDEYEVIITGFNARHVAANNHGRTCYWTYALTLEVLDAIAGAYEEIA